MSFDYFVAVHQRNWPSAAAVQKALESLGFPLRLTHAPFKPFEVADFREGLAVEFEGKPVILEAFVEQAVDADEPESLFGYIAECSAPNFKISNGDYFLTLTFRSDADQIRAGLFLAAALILSFDGYGFENQYESHGSKEFADQLLAEASNAAAFERKEPEVRHNPDFRFPGETLNQKFDPTERGFFGRIKSIFGIK